MFAITLSCYSILQIGPALSQDIHAYLATRFLGGLFAAAPLTNAGGIIGLLSVQTVNESDEIWQLMCGDDFGFPSNKASLTFPLRSGTLSVEVQRCPSLRHLSSLVVSWRL